MYHHRRRHHLRSGKTRPLNWTCAHRQRTPQHPKTSPVQVGSRTRHRSFSGIPPPRCSTCDRRPRTPPRCLTTQCLPHSHSRLPQREPSRSCRPCSSCVSRSWRSISRGPQLSLRSRWLPAERSRGPRRSDGHSQTSPSPQHSRRHQCWHPEAGRRSGTRHRSGTHQAQHMGLGCAHTAPASRPESRSVVAPPRPAGLHRARRDLCRGHRTVRALCPCRSNFEFRRLPRTQIRSAPAGTLVPRAPAGTGRALLSNPTPTECLLLSCLSVCLPPRDTLLHGKVYTSSSRLIIASDFRHFRFKNSAGEDPPLDNIMYVPIHALMKLTSVARCQLERLNRPPALRQ